MSDTLKHFGVKGMKWGRRKDKTGPGKVEQLKTRVGQELGSLKRERQWKQLSAKVGSMSTKDINKAAQRIQMENDLKRLSRNKEVGSKKDKQDYLNRAKMSDQELARKVVRLRAKDNLNRTIKDASKEQVELGKKIVDVAGSLVVKKVTGGLISPDDIVKAYKNPKQARDKAQEELIEKMTKKLAGATS